MADAVPPNRIPWWHRTVSAVVLAACTVTFAGLCAGLSWLVLVVFLGGCARLPSFAPADPGFVGPPSPAIVTMFVPDTSETFWILRLLAYAAFAVGFFCVLGAIATRVIGLGIGFSNLLIAGLSCFAAGVGMSALQYFLQAYLRVVVFGCLILGVIALIPLYRAFYNWAKFRLGQKLAAEGDYRAGVSQMAAASPKINKVRKQVLEGLERGTSLKGAIRQATGAAP